MNADEIVRVLNLAKAPTLKEREKALRSLAYTPRMPDAFRAEMLKLVADCSDRNVLQPISLQPDAAATAGIPEVIPGPDAELAPHAKKIISDWCEAWQRADELLSKGCPLPGPLFFSGPPGTGKSTALAGIAARLAAGRTGDEPLPLNNWKFYTLHSWMVVDSHLGESASKLIKQAQIALRCGGLVLEEIDALAMHRGGEHSASHENSRITIALMHLIETANAPMIFTTNRLDIIDPAVIRRCEAVVQFNEPSLDAKYRILARVLGLDSNAEPSAPINALCRTAPIVELIPLARSARRRSVLRGSSAETEFTAGVEPSPSDLPSSHTRFIEVVSCGSAREMSPIPSNRPDGSRRCPFFASFDTGDRTISEKCQLAERRIYTDDPERPEWCPLAADDGHGLTLVKLRPPT